MLILISWKFTYATHTILPARLLFFEDTSTTMPEFG